MLQWENRKVLVLGLGDTGLSMTRWLVRHGARVRVADSRVDAPHARTLAREHPDIHVSRGSFQAADFADVDAIAISPGVDRRIAPLNAALERRIPAVGDVEIFAQALAHLSR